MNINLKLSGIAERIVDEMIAKGYAASKTEAIRTAILDYSHHHLKPGLETPLQITTHANRDIWEDENEDKTWAKYLKGGKK
jgi:Arc/MetJ-type ribon-helix-helix transcriptional regulator